MARGADEAVFYELRGELVCETPVHVGYGARVGFIRLTRPYIPGSFLRGFMGLAIARLVCVKEELPTDHYTCEHRHKCPYAILFGEREAHEEPGVIFRFAYPIHEGCGGIFLPAPLTLLYHEECGFKAGYRHDEKSHDFEVEPFCAKCGKGLRPYGGFICDRCGELTTRPVRTNRLVRTAVDRERFSAFWKLYEGERAGSLHALDVIERGTRFRLSILLNAKLGEFLDVVREALEKCLPDEGLGASSSRGLGKLSVRNFEVREITPEVVLSRADEIDLRGFCLRLLSPAIVAPGQVRDGFLEPSSLEAYARKAYSRVFKRVPRLSGLRPVEGRFRCKATVVSGWSLKKGVRRALEGALDAGCVMEYRAEHPEGPLAEALAALELCGSVGKRGSRGFGQVAIEGVAGM